jgi:hypothetical protein
MNSNEILAVIRSHVERIDAFSLDSEATVLASAFQALDEHLTNGGTLPEEWMKNQPLDI